jgi:aconitase B
MIALVLGAYVLVFTSVCSVLDAYMTGRAAAKRVSECCQWADEGYFRGESK